MKLTPQMAEAIKHKGAVIVARPMTEEKHEHMLVVSVELADWLTNHTEGPIEAYEVLQIVLDALGAKFGIKGIVTCEEA